jgi:phosphoglycerate dehydrogenase-like enzyme
MANITEDAAPAVLYLDMADLDVEPGRTLLRQHGVEVLSVADDPDVDSLSRVVALLTGYDPVDDGWLDRLPALRMVATHSAGFDMVDLHAARRRGLWVANIPGAATDEVAVHALAMVLSLIRRLPAFDRDVRAGRWLVVDRELPRLPADLVCGVVGMGRIGRRFAELALPLFGKVVSYDPLVPESAWPAGIERVGLDELWSFSDCVSLHLPVTEATTHVVDADALALLPPGAVVVNVSRGELIDEPALLAALRSGRLRGAACDVLAHEPPDPADPLLAEDRLLLSPHVAYLSPGTLRRYAEVPARNVIALLTSGAPLNPVLTPTTFTRKRSREESGGRSAP